MALKVSFSFPDNTTVDFRRTTQAAMFDQQRKFSEQGMISFLQLLISILICQPDGPYAQAHSFRHEYFCAAFPVEF
jgi:hypothetical protein